MTEQRPRSGEEPNGYSPLWSITWPEPRVFARRLADAGVPNSVGTFGLCAAPLHPACRLLDPAPCPAAADRLLAVVAGAKDTEADLHAYTRIIQKEALAWTEQST
ncbi:hypothetical protein [Planomonospora algeriensis]